MILVLVICIHNSCDTTKGNPIINVIAPTSIAASDKLAIRGSSISVNSTSSPLDNNNNTNDNDNNSMPVYTYTCIT